MVEITFYHRYQWIWLLPLTVIGWFIQVLLDRGVNFAIYHWGGGGAGPDLPAALERLRIENECLLESVKDLKDAEDILSELDNYRLQEEVEGNDNSRLTREMLQILLVQGSNNITGFLMEDLCPKKFLLVMEDGWDDADRQKWDMLCGPLEFGKPGSRILVTTLLDTVVRMVEVEYLSLFNKCAFDDEEHNDHLNLAEIGK